MQKAATTETLDESVGESASLETGPGGQRARRWTMALFAVLGLLILLGPATAPVSSSCTVCHSSETLAGTWRGSAHSDVACVSCHSDLRVALGLANSIHLASGVAWSLPGISSPAEPWVPDRACIQCHAADMATISQTSGLRMSHFGLSEEGYTCTDCHADIVHSTSDPTLTRPTMSLCTSCHNGTDESGSCDLCHVPREPGDERRKDLEWSVTHGARWESTHGMGDLRTCTLCHPRTRCEGCHGIPMPHDPSFGVSHGRQVLSDSEPCWTCHKTAFCDSCHGLQMPHPAGFIQEHTTVAEGRDDEACLTCHVSSNCAECHTRHTHPGRIDRFRRPAHPDTKG